MDTFGNLGVIIELLFKYNTTLRIITPKLYTCNLFKLFYLGYFYSDLCTLYLTR